MPAIRTRPDTLPTGLLLACAGGFLDAYTFVGRGGVFANAQTGNIVLLGVEAPVSDMGIPFTSISRPSAAEIRSLAGSRRRGWRGW
jgi:hypothetical protein